MQQQGLQEQDCRKEDKMLNSPVKNRFKITFPYEEVKKET